MKLVLFLNMGGVSNLKDCQLFLKNMFNDPYILPIKNRFLRAFVAFLITSLRVRAMRKNYEHIGGKSPLNTLTQSLCQKLQKKNKNLNFDFINLYVPPFTMDVLSRYKLKKEDTILLFPLYPHYSYTTVKTSLEQVKKIIIEQKVQSKIEHVDVFYQNKLYNKMVISHILKANINFKAKTLIFSAHSLPLSVVEKGDLYEKQINAHIAILKQDLSQYFDEFILCYQSKLGPVKWLGPNTSDILANLKDKALIYPISFCVDCSETIFELEIEYRKIASKDYKVVQCPNDSDEFVEFILENLR